MRADILSDFYKDTGLLVAGLSFPRVARMTIRWRSKKVQVDPLLFPDGQWQFS